MRDIFDCTAAIEEFQSLAFKDDYIQLFEKARYAESHIEKSETLKISENWRTKIKKEMNEKNVLELVRLQITKTIAKGFLQPDP